MPRYLIERTYTVDMDELPTVATRSKAIGHHHYPEIVWEHSHVVVGTDGTPKSFCIYDAPNEEMVREHAQQLGDHIVDDDLRDRRRRDAGRLPADRRPGLARLLAALRRRLARWYDAPGAATAWREP